MPVKSVPTLGWTRRTAAVSVLLAMDEHRTQAGQRLRVLREQKGWSQEDLAREAKLSTKTVSRFENGRHDGRRGTVRSLAEALGVDELTLLGPPPTPLGLGQETAATDPQEQLDRMEAELEAARIDRQNLHDQIAQQNDLLARQSQLLAKIEKLVRVLEGAEVEVSEPAADGEADLGRPPAAPEGLGLDVRNQKPSQRRRRAKDAESPGRRRDIS